MVALVAYMLYLNWRLTLVFLPWHRYRAWSWW